MDFFFSRAVMLKLATITHKQALYSWSTAAGTVRGPPCMVRFNQILYIVHLEAKVPYVYKKKEFSQKAQTWYFQKTAGYAFTSGLGTFGVLVSPRECSSSTLDHFGILQFCMTVHVLKFCKNCLKVHILYLP